MTQRAIGRRSWIAAALAGAVAGGAAWNWRASETETVALTASEMQFWQSQWQQIDGVLLPMQGFSGHPLLLNFWATWCPPCVEELPLLNVFYQENKAKGWQVLGLAADRQDAVQRYLAAAPLQFPVALTGFEGIGLSKSLGNLSSGLPFTVVFNAAGRIVHRKIGKLAAQDLSALLQTIR